MKGEVVSTDATAKTITVKDAAGASNDADRNRRRRCVARELKAGDMVTVTKSENNATHITKAKAKPAKAAKAAKTSTPKADTKK